MRYKFYKTAPMLFACLAISAPLASQEEKSESDELVDTFLPDTSSFAKFLKKALKRDKQPEETKDDSPKKYEDPKPREETPEEAKLAEQARAEETRKANAAKVARNNEYMSAFIKIQVEDAGTLGALSRWCTDNDNPSGACMNQVTSARKIDERMKALLADESAEKYLRYNLKTTWRPESPIRAAAVKIYGQDNSGNQAARDQLAKNSFRASGGGFLGCHSQRKALIEYHGTPDHVEKMDMGIGYSWDPEKLMREIAAIQQSGRADTLENAYLICGLRARWAELKMQEPTPPQAAKDLADARANLPVAAKDLGDVKTNLPKTETAYSNTDYRPVGALQNMLKDASNQPPSPNAAIAPSQTAVSMTTVTGEGGKSIGPSGPPIPEPKKKKIGLGNLIMGAAQGYMQYKAIKSGGDLYPSGVGGASTQTAYPTAQTIQGTRTTGGHGGVNPATSCISISNGRSAQTDHIVETIVFRNSCPYKVTMYYNYVGQTGNRRALPIEAGRLADSAVAYIKDGKREAYGSQIDTSNFFACRSDQGYGFSSGLNTCTGP